jgi:hypothetical protein
MSWLSSGSNPVAPAFFRNQPFGPHLEGLSSYRDLGLQLHDRVQKARREGLRFRLSRHNLFGCCTLGSSNPVSGSCSAVIRCGVPAERMPGRALSTALETGTGQPQLSVGHGSYSAPTSEGLWKVEPSLAARTASAYSGLRKRMATVPLLGEKRTS